LAPGLAALSAAPSATDSGGREARVDSAVAHAVGDLWSVDSPLALEVGGLPLDFAPPFTPVRMPKRSTVLSAMDTTAAHSPRLHGVVAGTTAQPPHASVQPSGSPAPAAPSPRAALAGSGGGTVVETPHALVPSSAPHALPITKTGKHGGGPSEQDGYVELVASTDRDVYSLGDTVHLTLSVTNHYSVTLNFHAPSERLNGWEILDNDTGEQVFYIAYGDIFETHTWPLQPNETIVFEDGWDAFRVGHFLVDGFLPLFDSWLWPQSNDVYFDVGG
jgi:hypothetical protein